MSIVCLLSASILSILNIVCFFGKSYSVLGIDEGAPTMFQIMFGLEVERNGYTSDYPMIDGLFVLFIFQFLITIVAIGGLYIARDSYVTYNDSKRIIAVSAPLGILVLISTILSFCTVEFYKDATNIGSSVPLGLQLGVGPILYSVFGLLCLFLLVVTIGIEVYSILNTPRKYVTIPYNSNNNPNQNYQQGYSQNNVSSTPTESTQKSFLDKENEKLELLLKYKKLLDEGVITEEEFEDIKKKYYNY